MNNMDFAFPFPHVCKKIKSNYEKTRLMSFGYRGLYTCFLVVAKQASTGA